MGEVIMVDMRVRISAPGMTSPYNGKTGTVRSVAGGTCQVKLDDGRRLGIASKCCVPLVTIPPAPMETGIKFEPSEWSEQQPEPKTERKVVIAFLDVQEGASENVIITTMSEDENGWVINHDAKTIDAARVRKSSGVSVGDVIYTVVPFPEPEPETMKDVLNDISNVKGGLNEAEIASFQKRIRAAKERSK